MKKQILALLLAFMLLLSAVLPAAATSLAAGGNTTVNIPKTFPIIKQDPSSTVISFWHTMTGSRGTALININNWFNATVGKQKKIYVKPIFQGGYDDILLKVAATVQARNPKALPDLVQLSASGFFAAKESKNIIIMGDLMKNDPLFTKMMDKLNANSMYACSYKGKQYGLPFMNSTIMLHYNTDAFRSVGLDPNQPPKTLAEYADVCAKLMIRGKGKNPTRYGGCGKVTNNFVCNWISRQKNGTAFQFNQEDGYMGVPTKYTAGPEGTMKTLLTQWHAVLATGGYNSTPSSYLVDYANGYSCSFFGSSVLSMDVQSNFAAIKDKSKLFKSGMARYPSVNADDAIGTGVAGSSVYMFDRGIDASKQATWEFVKFLTSVDVSAYWATQTGYFIVNQDALNTKYMKDYFAKDSSRAAPYQVFAETQKYPKFQTPLIPSYSAYDSYVQDQIMQMTLGKRTADEVVAGISKKAAIILDTYAKMHQ